MDIQQGEIRQKERTYSFQFFKKQISLKWSKKHSDKSDESDTQKAGGYVQGGPKPYVIHCTVP